MKPRTLRRRILIRLRDFEKVKKQALCNMIFIDIKEPLYDRADFQPITQREVEHEILLKTLKGESLPKHSLIKPYNYLFHHYGELYNDRYTRWRPKYDINGVLTTQSQVNRDPEIMGWATFEKDLE